MDRSYALHYRELYERHWWWRAREDLVLSTLERWTPADGWGSILDVGCGNGLLFEKLQRFGDVEGIEMDPTAVTSDCVWASRIRLGPFDETFQPGKRYPLILMLDVLEHFRDPVAALRRAQELSEHNGILILTVPAFPMLWTSHDDLNHHHARYTRRSLTAVAESSGLRLISSRYFFRWVVPLKLAVRLKEQLFGATAKTPSIPSDWLNRLLYRLSRVEEKALGRLPLAFGGSLLAVAQNRNRGS